MQETFKSSQTHSNSTLWTAQVNESTEGEEHCGPARPERICSSGGGRVMAELIRALFFLYCLSKHIKLYTNNFFVHFTNIFLSHITQLVSI